MAEENQGKEFSSKDITDDKDIMQSYVDSGGGIDIGESVKNIAGSQKVSEAMRKMFIDEVTSVEKEIDPNRDDKKAAYDFFSPIIGRSIKFFKEKIEKGESIDEVAIKGKAKDVATKISKYAGDLSSKPISDIVYNHIRLKDLENADSYEDVEKKIEDSGVGSMKDLMKFFLDSKDLVDKPDPGIDSKLLNEMLAKHNILLNGVAILLKDLGIKNPSFEGAEKNFDDAIKTFNPKSLEGVNNEFTDRGSIENASDGLITSKNEPRSLEPLKEISDVGTTEDIGPASVTTPIQTQSSTISIISEVRPKENMVSSDRTQISVMPVSQSQPISIGKENLIKNISTSLGIENVGFKEPFPIKNYSPQESPIRSTSLGGILAISGNEDLGKYGSSSIGSIYAEKSSPISMESIKPDLTKIMEKAPGAMNLSTATPIIEKSSLKMAREVQPPQKKENQVIESTPEKSSTSQVDMPTDNIAKGDETKSESSVKNNEIQESGNTNENNVKMDQKVLLSILSAMQDIREILSGPLIVTDSKNNFS